MLFQTWLDLLLVKQLPNRKGRRPGTKPRDKPAGLSLYSIPTHDMLSLSQSFQATLQKMVELRRRVPAGSNRSA